MLLLIGALATGHSVPAQIEGATTGARSRQSEQVHPIAARIERPTAPQHLVPVSAVRDARTELPSSVSGGTRVRVLGGQTGPIAEAFGNIRAVAMDDAGYTYVVDAEYNDVRVITPDGRLAQRLGPVGTGTLRWRGLTTVVVGAGGMIHLGDVGRRVHSFRRVGDTLAHVRSLAIAAAPASVCVGPRATIVQSQTLDTLGTVRVVDASGRDVRRFGRFYRTENLLLSHALHEAVLACSPDGGIVVVAPAAAVHDVRGYAPDGRPLWVAVLGGLISPVLSAANGGLGVQLPSAGYHRTRRLLWLPDGGCLVQVEHVVPPATRDGSERVVATLSVLVNTRTGAAVNLGSALPSLAAVSKAGYVVRGPGSALEIWKARGQTAATSSR